MTYNDVLLQQVINGVSLGAMYALLALGFTMVYGIIELINFAHFNIFMVGSFFAMWVLKLTGLVGQRVILTGFPLVGVLLLALVCVMLFCGILGVVIERTMLRPMRNVPGTAAMITTIGVSYILFNVILLSQGAAALNFPNPMPNVVWKVGGRDPAPARGPPLGHRAGADGRASISSCGARAWARPCRRPPRTRKPRG